MKTQFKITILIVVVILVSTIYLMGFQFYKNAYETTPLEVYHKERYEGLEWSLDLIETQEDSKVILPKTFNVGKVNLSLGQRTEQWNKKDLFYCKLQAGDSVEFGFNSSHPVWFIFTECDEPSWNMKEMALIFEDESILSYDVNVTADYDKVLCFRFQIEPPNTSKIYFTGFIRKHMFE